MDDATYLRFVGRKAQQIREKSGVKKRETRTVVYYNVSSKDAMKQAFQEV